MAFGSEYSNDYAYFIAGGKTLEAIKKYEDDLKNVKQLTAAIAAEFGADTLIGGAYNGTFFSKTALAPHPAIVLENEPDGGRHTSWKYKVNTKTLEGQVLQARIDDIPEFDLGQRVFAKRVSGHDSVVTNPDNLHDSNGYSSSHYSQSNEATAVTYQKIGDDYVLSVPRVIRGVFNEESRKASLKDHYDQAAGYRYEWFTPPDSTPIPYSKLVELREQEKGDQLAQRTVMKPGVPAFKTRR